VGSTLGNVVRPPPIPPFFRSVPFLISLSTAHILRLLSTHHILREVRPDVFANNRISALMDSGKDSEGLKVLGRSVVSPPFFSFLFFFLLFAVFGSRRSSLLI
jgi:hypothetical protein